MNSAPSSYPRRSLRGPGPRLRRPSFPARMTSSLIGGVGEDASFIERAQDQTTIAVERAYRHAVRAERTWPPVNPRTPRRHRDRKRGVRTPQYAHRIRRATPHPRDIDTPSDVASSNQPSQPSSDSLDVTKERALFLRTPTARRTEYGRRMNRREHKRRQIRLHRHTATRGDAERSAEQRLRCRRSKTHDCLWRNEPDLFGQPR